MIRFWIDLDKAREKIYEMIDNYKESHPRVSTFDSTWNIAYDIGASDAVNKLFELLKDKSAFKVSYTTEEDSGDC